MAKERYAIFIKKINWFMVVIAILLAVYAVSLVFPLLWGIMNSFKAPLITI